jgi:C-terminal processing protease CtpA/Prc
MYLMPNEHQKMATNLFAYGFGAGREADGRIRIVTIWEGSPADRSGLKVGEEIIRMTDGASDISLEEYIFK